MDVVRILGGSPLKGEVRISGSKNASLPALAACLLTEEPCILRNVPDLSDVRFMVKILEHLGAKIDYLDSHSLLIHAKTIHGHTPYDLVRKMRASICLMGPLIARLRKAEISLPGGCVIGSRPIDLHLKGFRRMGCEISIENGYVKIDGSHLKGADIFLGGRFGSTVTGTVNIIMAAVLSSGKTHIDSCACEPEVVDLCNLLVSMGAKIRGIGSHSLTIEGVDQLHGTDYSIIEDRVEMGTFVIAGLMHEESEILIKNGNVKFLGALIHTLEEMNAQIHVINEKEVLVKGCQLDKLRPVELTTLPYPGFPTDLQAQMCSLAAIVPGLSIITERIYPSRFMHVSEMQRMGAKITLEGSSAIITGKRELSGAPVMASDLRASAALYLSGLCASGETIVQRVYHLDRGYEKFDVKLRELGASIERFPESELQMKDEIV